MGEKMIGGAEIFAGQIFLNRGKERCPERFADLLVGVEDDGASGGLGFCHGGEGWKREKREERYVTKKISSAEWTTRAHDKYL